MDSADAGMDSADATDLANSADSKDLVDAADSMDSADLADLTHSADLTDSLGYLSKISQFHLPGSQWNLSKVDTHGIEVFVLFREVSALERFELKSFQI